MAWHQTCAKPLSKPMMTQLSDIYIYNIYHKAVYIWHIYTTVYPSVTYDAGTACSTGNAYFMSLLPVG